MYLRERTLLEAFNRLPKDTLLSIVEVGTLRNDSLTGIIGDGWSTYYLAGLLQRPPGGVLVSIDQEAGNIETSKRCVPEAWHPSVRWICAPSAVALPALALPRIDMLFLDSGDDPQLAIDDFTAVRHLLTSSAPIVIDDTGNYGGNAQGKGTLLIPLLESLGWGSHHREGEGYRMTILLP